MRVNLIHSKLVFQISKKKKIYCSRSREQCEWNQFTALVFWKKTALFTLMNSAEKKSSRELLWFFLRFKRNLQWAHQKKKMHFCVYQTIVWLWLVQTQKQPRKQTDSVYKKKSFLMGSAVRKEPTAMGYFQ